MTVSGWIWKVLLALLGCIAAAYVFEEVIGGGALGYSVCGAILGVTVGPLLSTILSWRKLKDAERASTKDNGNT